MSSQQYTRTLCWDCATPRFISGEMEAAGTRCERCVRKYDEQLYLLRAFLARPERPFAE